MTEILKQVIATLDGVEVHGRDNLDRVLGCIRALETVVQVMEQPTEAPKEEAKEVTDG